MEHQIKHHTLIVAKPGGDHGAITYFIFIQPLVDLHQLDQADDHVELFLFGKMFRDDDIMILFEQRTYIIRDNTVGEADVRDVFDFLVCDLSVNPREIDEQLKLCNGHRIRFAQGRLKIRGTIQNIFAYLDTWMNFLAHLYLSGDNEQVMVGNFIGDFVKGKNLRGRFDTDIARGIELHRGIDYFTDMHRVVKESKNRLRAKYRHYSGVIVDVFYDHFLASNWSRYSDLGLDAFAQNAYRVVNLHSAILPEEVTRMLPYMIRGNWLVNYSRIEGIDRALSGMARRTAYESHMNEAADDLRKSYASYATEFEAFFPEIRQWASEWLQKNPS